MWTVKKMGRWIDGKTDNKQDLQLERQDTWIDVRSKRQTGI